MKRHLPYLVLIIATAMALPVAYAEMSPADGAVAEISSATSAVNPGKGADKTEKGNGKGKGKGKGQTTTTAAAEESQTTTTAPTTTSTTTASTLIVTTAETTTTAPATTTTAPTTTTTTTAPTTTTTAPATTTSSTTTTTTQPPDGPVEWVSPEGVTIIIDSAGGWTTERIYQLLLENAIELDVIGPTLTIKVQDKDLSSTASGASSSGGVYTSFSAIIYLKGNDPGFIAGPDSMIAHEYGHAWSRYHLYMTQQNDWSAYLDFRGLSGDSRLDTTYPWSRGEIIAEDYRLLFSSPTALDQWPGQMNSDIPDARDVPGLADFLQNVWGG